MNTSALKTFAPAVRRQLIEAVTRKLDYVLTARTPDLLTVYALQVASLGKLAQTDRNGLVERVAYTWFNRFAALRFMDAHGWHPFRARIITPVNPDETQPEILRSVLAGSLPAELAPFADPKRINSLLDGTTPSPDPQGEVYRHLVLAACRFYNALLPNLFERLDDETELLLPDDLLTEQSVVQGFRTEISDADCSEVEILGWLYQFYISERKDQVMARKSAVPTEDIPAVTQLFTPHWIVRYLVENSLGLLWLLNRPQSKLREHMPYYIQGDPETDFLKINRPEDIRICDPACGSGHMLTYAFDLLYRIYEEEGYSPSEIPGLILKHNLYGLEICPRAAQLAQFALVCKAREKYRNAFRNPIESHVICLQDIVFEDSELPMEWLWISDQWPAGNVPARESILHDLHLFTDAQNFGSLLQPKLSEYQLAHLKQRVAEHWPQNQDALRSHSVRGRVLRVLEQAEALTQRYHVVVANPPYMGAKQMDAPLFSFCENNYPLGSADLFSCFIERAETLSIAGGISGLITMQGWLFQPSFVALRRQVFAERRMSKCLHLGAAAFDTIGGEVVKTVAFTLNTGVTSNTCLFFDLTIPRGESRKEQVFLNSLAADRPPPHQADLDTRLFLRIPGAPAFYKNSEAMVEVFETSPSLGSLSALKAGLTTGDNVAFQRLWHEVSNDNIFSGCSSLDESGIRPERWYPCSSGGEFRKWYRKSSEVVDWQSNGERIRNFTNESGKLKSRPQNTQYYFRRGFTWNKLSTSNFAVRLQECGWIYDDTSRCGYPNVEKDFDRLFAFLCSSVSPFFLGLLNPSMSFTSGDLGRLPIIDLGELEYVTVEAVSIARADWDNFETSWDFQDLPLLRPDLKGSTLEVSWRNWKGQSTAAIRRMQELETENNRLFIEAYGLQDELKPDVPEDQITLSRADVRKDMATFLSYVIGCIMGRYSLDCPGLILANQGESLQYYLDKVGATVSGVTFLPDADGVIPVLDGDWFEDDIVSCTRDFLRATYSENTLRENLRFIEESLGKDIRKYFLNDFYKDHLQTYKKRPIYWLVQSPKKGFSVLIYLHRYTRDTLNIVLNRYLRPYQDKLRGRISHLEQAQADPGASLRDKTASRKEAEKLVKTLHECEEWERDTLLPLAQQRIELDLDDGVKVNYLKLGEALAPIPGLATKEED
jgi:hypothetical protein